MEVPRHRLGDDPCAAVALRNVTALSAEVLSLGGHAAGSMEEYIVLARSAAPELPLRRRPSWLS
jgi:hypothetical protein